MDDNIILYSTGCPMCSVLKQKLTARQIPFTENNDVDEMLAMGLVSAPVLSVNGKLLPFKEANDWVNQH